MQFIVKFSQVDAQMKRESVIVGIEGYDKKRAVEFVKETAIMLQVEADQYNHKKQR